MSQQEYWQYKYIFRLLQGILYTPTVLHISQLMPQFLISWPGSVVYIYNNVAARDEELRGQLLARRSALACTYA